MMASSPGSMSCYGDGLNLYVMELLPRGQKCTWCSGCTSLDRPPGAASEGSGLVLVLGCGDTAMAVFQNCASWSRLSYGLSSGTCCKSCTI